MTVTNLPNWFTVAQAADHTGLSTWTIRKEIAAGNLLARRIGRSVRITDAELSRWMLGHPSTGDAAHAVSPPLGVAVSTAPSRSGSSLPGRSLSHLADGDSHPTKENTE